MNCASPAALFALISIACLLGCPGGGAPSPSGRLDRFYPSAPATADTDWVTIRELEEQRKILFGLGSATILRRQLGIGDPYDLELRADLEYRDALNAGLRELGDAAGGLHKTLEKYHWGLIRAGESPVLERGEPVPEPAPDMLVSFVQSNNVRYVITVPIDETSALSAAHARLEQAKADMRAFLDAVSRAPVDAGDEGEE